MKRFPCFHLICHFSCKRCRYFSAYLYFYSSLLLLWSNVTYGVSGDDSSNGAGAGALQNSKYISDYLHALQRSQNEIFRKIDWLTKRMEEKDHEHYQFRLKFSRKVHTLENKVLYMEQTFTQKVEQVVQKKVDEMMTSSDNNRLSYHTISGSSSSSNSRDSHGSPTKGVGDDDVQNDDDSSAPIMEIQSHQPMQPSYNYIHQSQHNNPYIRYQYNAAHQLQLPSYTASSTSQRNSQNWGFYEHPITHKRVRDSQTRIFGVGGFEPPTRDLPRITLVATGATPLNYNNVVGDNQPEQHQSSRLTQNSSDVKGGSSSLSSTPSLTANSSSNRGLIGETTEGPVRERDGGRKSSKNCDDHKKKFESYDLALKSLRENVTSLEREILRALSHQNRENDNSEMVRLLVDAKKEVTGIHQKHEEMVHRIEHFTVEMEKAAAKREHSVNESLREMSSELRKQITAVKGYVKKQIQNVTLQTSGTQHGVTRTPDKLQCAQFVLDELLAHLSKPKALQSQAMQPDHHRGLIADQAGGRSDSDEQKGNERGSGSPYMSRRSVDRQSSETLIRELESQKKEIMELKSEIGKLNISQILLMRTVDEETLKRTVRPRDCTEIRLLRNATSGIYSIFPQMNDVSTEVYCDMVTDGGGWTVIQRRGVPIPEESRGIRESFARNWDEYEKGFGSLSGDFWLGLSKIVLLCKLGIQELRIDLTNWSGETKFAHYQYFKILNASQLYTLNVKGYSGTAGDSLSRHSGMAFSTPDFDHDVDPRRHCAKTYFSGWWYYACFESNLNGLYIGDHENDEAAFGAGIIWHNWMGLNYSLKIAEMKIRNRFI